MAKQSLKASPLRQALAYVVPYWRQLVLVLALSAAGTLLTLTLPYFSKLLVDDAFLGRDTGMLVRIVGLFLLVTVLSFLMNVVSGLRYTRVSAEILFDMRLALYRHLQRLSPRFYARMPLGQIISRLNNDIGEIQRVAAETVLAWLGSAIMLVGTVGMLAFLDWKLFLVSVLFLPGAVWALIRYRRLLERAVAVLRDRSADIGSFLIETLRGVGLVVRSNAQEREADRFRRKNDGFIASLLSMQRLTYLAGGLPGLLLSAGTAAVFLYGGWRVIGGTLTLGTFVAFTAYQMRLLSPVEAIMGLYTGLATLRVSLGRVQELFDEPVEVADPDPGAALSLPPVRGRIVLESATVSHDRGVPVLQEASFAVEPGEVVALVGRSGSGKSTVAHLLVRLLDPDGGKVLLDGNDLRSLRLAEVRRHVARVDQDPFLFNASIHENVRYARPEASGAEVAAALRAAGLEDFVATLPEGLNTLVGELGGALSAGERQRMAIAHAFLADPSVLVLDEATASLDPVTEAEVLAGYDAIMRDRTTVIISHRRELALRADRVIVLAGGRVVEEGRPRALLRKRGAFHELFGDGGGPAPARRR